jgi:hypothetical protein
MSKPSIASTSSLTLESFSSRAEFRIKASLYQLYFKLARSNSQQGDGPDGKSSTNSITASLFIPACFLCVPALPS